ncbi:MAG: C4-dicarboxylate ABC transporter substrate-binding protein, partial [Pseudomonadota bacterium]
MTRHALLLAATATLALPAGAETLSVVGSWSSLPLHNQYEAPFWTETLPSLVDGLEVELTTHNQMNLGLGDIYPLLGQGVYDVA